MSDIRQARKALVARILEGDGKASIGQRRAAFDNMQVREPWTSLCFARNQRRQAIFEADL
jgi:hypothetical protein